VQIDGGGASVFEHPSNLAQDTSKIFSSNHGARTKVFVPLSAIVWATRL
jgi:hypothetical protein